MLAACVLAWAAAGPPVSAQPAPAPPSWLPAGEGRELVWVHCSICHDLGLVRQQRLDRGTWNGVLDDMKKFGAFFTEEQRPEILDFLLKHYGPKT